MAISRARCVTTDLHNMEIIQIIAIGFGSGLLLSVLSIAFFNSSNAEKFPLGGFLPALWLVSDLGGSSQLVEGGMLVMGGMLGYYMILSMWRGMPNRFSEILPQAQDAGHHVEASVPKQAAEESII